jgi:uncharacterized sulfatase
MFIARIEGQSNFMKTNTIENCLVQSLFAIAVLGITSSNALFAQTRSGNPSPPNILFCISDDQSYAHTGANGDPVVKTPAFDRIAREGLRFTHAFCDAPTCGPSRSAILTGQPIWRLEEAANIWSTLPAKFATYPSLLREAGYKIGYTGKGWGPGRLEPGGRVENPAGARYSSETLRPPFRGMNQNDYAGNFEKFMAELPKEQPFCFWLGTSEPHRGYELGSGKRSGKDPNKINVPPFFPDNEIVRNDILDYLVEIEHFDSMVERSISSLEKRGLLDNTIVVVTSDHGMPFPRAKATVYDAGSRVPLAIRWANGIKNPGREVSAPVNLSDLATTFIEAAGLEPPAMMTGRSMLDLFADNETVLRKSAFVGFERHSGARAGGKGYPCRVIRTRDFMYVYNFEPTRWPAGSPDPLVCNRLLPFGEYDSSPTKTFMIEHRLEHGVADRAELAFGKRPHEELYDLRADPHQMQNVAGSLKYEAVQKSLRSQLFAHLTATQDPRVVGGVVDWDFYPHYGNRTNKNWKVDQRK